MREYQRVEILEHWNRYFIVLIDIFSDLITFFSRYVFGHRTPEVEQDIEEATEQFPPGTIAAQMFAQLAIEEDTEPVDD